MSATHPIENEVVDRRRPVDRLLGNYSEDHRNATNQLIHWICVPLIVWTVVALAWLIPVPPGIGRPGLWAALAMVAALAFYLRLSRTLGLTMFLVFAVYAAITELMYRVLGPVALLWTAVGVFVAAWVAQFIGHEIEGRRPSFLTDLVYLLVGPLWLASKALRRFGVAY
jgi:uncharacterized membrane protein YGL010W